MKINSIWFEDDYLYGKGDDGKTYRQSLLWYPHLRDASDNERNEYSFSTIGIHWRKLDEDVSFESFKYDDAEPSQLQKFFLSHKEINIAEFAKMIGLTLRFYAIISTDSKSRHRRKKRRFWGKYTK
jgi:hypothetical protein